MSFIRNLPLKYRLPLIHTGLWVIAAFKSISWKKADIETAILPGDLVVSGFFSESLGIGRAGRLNVMAFSKAGLKHVEHDIRPCFSHFLGGHQTLPGNGGVWLIHANAPEALVALMAHPAKDWANRYRIGFWVWETPIVPRMWVWAADFFHEIWVPSAYVHDALIKSLKKAHKAHLIGRMRLMPYPLPELGSVLPSPISFGLEAGYRHFLCLFDTNSSVKRKNPWDVLEAWLAAFPNSSRKARLTLKVQNLGSDQKAKLQLDAALKSRHDIRLFEKRLTDDEMMTFVASFDVLVSLHRSEGFGLPLAEAMAMGVEVIATDYSGNRQFMSQNNAWLVPSIDVPIDDPEGNYAPLSRRKGQVWAQPNIKEAAHLIEARAAASRDQVRLDLAKMAISALGASWKREALLKLPFARYLNDEAAADQLSE